ncbi:hypothetical protein GL213_02105 [Halogeometricum borinquense]|uniref:DUF8152 domain-containing protein n=1 Tax=Halogeometricum borinquense TaxID=60847 RepID=A0A6C0UL22_9EURY|nr:hypothetical protein [Halogeometricum borinquense]QIB76134.1 hypothetical protein G3I44_18795 [Halogeometricum borinquense]QIQ75430.1 hypothetical protein GL213_02105 [Halogeometricum borinquense]
MTSVDEATRAKLRKLHDHLAATAERPVERTASAHLGEAEAVTGDVADDPNVAPAVVESRIETVSDLLSNVEKTGDDAADKHVERARELVAELLSSE